MSISSDKTVVDRVTIRVAFSIVFEFGGGVIATEIEGFELLFIRKARVIDRILSLCDFTAGVWYSAPVATFECGLALAATAFLKFTTTGVARSGVGEPNPLSVEEVVGLCGDTKGDRQSAQKK